MFVGGFVVSTILYLVWGRTATPEGAFGGTVPGLWFGIVGSVLMLAAAFLAVRKKWPVSPLIPGTASFWLHVHLWLGTLSVWVILLHTGFRFGGPFEQILMWCFLVVAFSGFYGLVVQQYVPRAMTDQVPSETFAQQVPVLCRRLLVEADWLTADAAGTLPMQSDVDADDVEPVFEELKGYFKDHPEQDRFKRRKITKVEDFVGYVYLPEPDPESENSNGTALAEAGGAAVETVGAEAKPDFEAAPVATAALRIKPQDPMAERLQNFYVGVVRPYLRGDRGHGALRSRAIAEVQFDSLRSPLPPKLRLAAQEIEQICDVRRQYWYQRRLLWWLHSWLYLHVPASMALIVLFLLHVYLALRVVPPG